MGPGTLKHRNGNDYFGECKNDKRDGHGTMTYAFGNVYIGGWKNGLMEGSGTGAVDGKDYIGESATWANNGSVSIGEF